MFGSISNLVILRESRQHFDRNTCFYLQALSVSDIFYLCFMIGYLVIPIKRKKDLGIISLYFSLSYQYCTLSTPPIGPGSITWLIGVWSSPTPSWHPRLASCWCWPSTITSWHHIISGQLSPGTSGGAQTMRLPRVNIAIIRIRDLQKSLCSGSLWPLSVVFWWTSPGALSSPSRSSAWGWWSTRPPASATASGSVNTTRPSAATWSGPSPGSPTSSLARLVLNFSRLLCSQHSTGNW